MSYIDIAVLVLIAPFAAAFFVVIVLSWFWTARIMLGFVGDVFELIGFHVSRLLEKAK